MAQLCNLLFHWQTKPLQNLANAVSEMSIDLDQAPLKEEGALEIVAATRAFNRMQQKLQRYIQDRELLFRSISHDLKTPITRLRLRAELLDDEPLTQRFNQDLDDLEMLVKAGFLWKGGVIDTLRVSKHLIGECEGFSLQLLRYELKLYRGEKKLQEQYGIKDALVAHNALSDALVTKLLLIYLRDMASEEEMHALSFKEVLLEKFSFGKHKGKYIEEVCINDTSYAQWLLGCDTDEDIKYSINYYLQGNK